MKKLIFATLLIFSSCLVFSQRESDVKPRESSYYNLDFINVNPMEDLRTHKAGTQAIALMALVPIDLPSLLEVGDTADNELTNRLPEYIFPNFRYYISDRTVATFGLIYAQTSRRYNGEVVEDTTLAVIPESYFEKERKRKIAFRCALDQHYKPIRFKRFDLDPYIGGAVSLGFSPQVLEMNSTYVGGDYINYKETRSYKTYGLDAYVGCNFLYERFSLGLELIVLGADFQRGSGVVKYEISQDFGGTSVDQEYYQSETWNTGVEFNKLKMSDNQVSMYKGIRGVFCFYL
jgi:hypothetical protein